MICAGRLHSIAAKLQLSARISAETLHLHRVRQEQGKRIYHLDSCLLSHPLTLHSFLGVALTKVLLESRGYTSRRPMYISSGLPPLFSSTDVK